MRTIKDGVLTFPDNVIKKIQNGSLTSTIRPKLKELAPGKEFYCTDHEDETVARIKITDVVPLNNYRVRVEFEVI